MSADRVFATAKPGEAFVFRHNFSENKWENVTSKKDGSATVTFRKRGTAFFIRVHPDGGEKVRHSAAAPRPLLRVRWNLPTGGACSVANGAGEGLGRGVHPGPSAGQETDHRHQVPQPGDSRHFPGQDPSRDE